MNHSSPKSESFWLACLFGAVVLTMLVVMLTALLVLPWRSNFAVFQIPEKAHREAAPVINIPETPKKPL